ncbi:myb-like dna-binding shaqkyf class family protein [Stylonychia lemnae]|uniref:Myb-like dna-binding shaqkyf class family protein n=1 Tax=Stylonychia lemnae TaxID=5949 RepID=A0A078AFG6_STYLE|nr:myb-like dna-binding shaqkyf class family protein [Stylonychia lemnae]|eukprot:CDW79668.1 myb-like dna-binding shaqkyf class family protein [Stylonychia lemnae]
MQRKDISGRLQSNLSSFQGSQQYNAEFEVQKIQQKKHIIYKKDRRDGFVIRNYKQKQETQSIPFDQLINSTDLDLSKQSIRQSISENQQRKSRSVDNSGSIKSEVQGQSTIMQDPQITFDSMSSFSKGHPSNIQDDLGKYRSGVNVHNPNRNTQRTKEIVFQVNQLLEQKVNNGRWTKEEHAKFLEALRKYGKNWNKVFEHVKTRNEQQVRSHAQKYFNKLKQKKNIKNLDIYNVLMQYNSRMRGFHSKKTETEAPQNIIFMSSKTKAIQKDKSSISDVESYKKQMLFQVKRKFSSQTQTARSAILKDKTSPNPLTLIPKNYTYSQKFESNNENSLSSSSYEMRQTEKSLSSQNQAMQSVSSKKVEKLFEVTKMEKYNNQQQNTDNQSIISNEIAQSLVNPSLIQISNEELEQFIEWRNMQHNSFKKQIFQPSSHRPKNLSDEVLKDEQEHKAQKNRESLDSIFNPNKEQKSNRMAISSDQVNKLVDEMQRFSIEDEEKNFEEQTKNNQIFDQRSSYSSRMDIVSQIADQVNEHIDKNPNKVSGMSGISQYLQKGEQQQQHQGSFNNRTSSLGNKPVSLGNLMNFIYQRSNSEISNQMYDGPGNNGGNHYNDKMSLISGSREGKNNFPLQRSETTIKDQQILNDFITFSRESGKLNNDVLSLLSRGSNISGNVYFQVQDWQ